jgi:hypothetical protein
VTGRLFLTDDINNNKNKQLEADVSILVKVKPYLKIVSYSDTIKVGSPREWVDHE